MALLIKLSLLFTVIFCLGYGLSALLYKKQSKPFAKSSLQLKVLMWIPIFLLFLLFLAGPNWVRVAITAYVLLYISKELAVAIKHSRHKWLIVLFATTVGIGFSLLLALIQNYLNIVIAIGFASVLSDVFAFFIGNFYGRHPLPKAVNAQKSWEGVFGQIIGAAIGVLLITSFVTPVSLWLILPIGIGSAVGDMANSYVKRKHNIKDWGNTLPGHGGFLDRFSSLSFAALFTAILVLA